MERFDIETTMRRQIWLIEEMERRSWLRDIGTKEHTQILANIQKLKNWDAGDDEDAAKINKLYERW